jgi:hypothetical protein
VVASVILWRKILKIGFWEKEYFYPPGWIRHHYEAS